MPLLNTLSFVVNHPLNRNQPLRAGWDFLRWQLNTRLNPYPVVYPFGARSKLLVAKGMTGATGNIYCGLHEFADMGFLLHFLRPDDFFIDVGANIGSYTILAASEVGARVLSFEPIPLTYAHLQQNIKINQLEPLVTAHNLGLGAAAGSLSFTKGLDTMNHVDPTASPGSLSVPIQTLDALTTLSTPTLLKIDVEGFEMAVLQGMPQTLASPSLKAIIIEINGAGQRYGFNENELDALLQSHAFRPFAYNPFPRSLTALAPKSRAKAPNTIYLRELEWAAERLRLAPYRKIHRQVF
ncbi:MAG: FkbM family methyltransferase [Lewinella sp.]|nr:FkbM family methyltransferase [Lewinella sp.]